MGCLSSVVGVLLGAVLDGGEDGPLGSRAAAQVIGNESSGT